ncbi:MAG: mannitol dehydrogenase family protein [Paracoccaceae bacterium]
MKRIIHLGVGNFFRAHQAWYTHAAGGGWRITGVSLRRPDIRDALRPQGFAYTLAIRGAGEARMEEISVIDGILVAPEDPEAVIAALADPAVQVVTLTVTEKGYDLGADGALRLDAPGIAADLSAISEGRAPRSTIGLLAAGLARRAAGCGPITVLCCDNLPENGVRLGAAVRAYANAAGMEIGTYLSDHVAFPSSMVDRITPATDDALRAETAASGLPAAAPVATEAFTEWVIEDRFKAARPPWDKAGAVFTDDVRPYELRKLRMLNGAHSCLAYAGVLAGFDFVHQAVGDPALAALAAALMEEAAETLPAPVRADAPNYARALMARFANPAINHRLRQIAMDGSLKLPIRLLPTRAARAEMGLPSPAIDAALTAWLGFLEAEFEAGRAVDDPAADALRAALPRHRAEGPAQRAKAILADTIKDVGR